MTFVIAEISNHHLGSVKTAKDLIIAAKESGADAVKGQAFVPEDMLRYGTMPLEFYQRCAFGYSDYVDLIKFGRKNKIPVFFTVISQKFSRLFSVQSYQKLHARGFSEIKTKEDLDFYDSADTFISMNEPNYDLGPIKNANILCATQYLVDVDRQDYDKIRDFYRRPIGVSHHGRSYDNLLKLHYRYYLPFVEKHFYLGVDFLFQDRAYRDCYHSFDPDKFSSFVLLLKSFQKEKDMRLNLKH